MKNHDEMDISSLSDEEKKLYNTKDPETGDFFDIPMLITSDDGYVAKYVEYMKMREEQPAFFRKVIEWD